MADSEQPHSRPIPSKSQLPAPQSAGYAPGHDMAAETEKRPIQGGKHIVLLSGYTALTRPASLTIFKD